jgi:hypothetical protein
MQVLLLSLLIMVYKLDRYFDVAAECVSESVLLHLFCFVFAVVLFSSLMCVLLAYTCTLSPIHMVFSSLC